jgi:hypothetical protein
MTSLIIHALLGLLVVAFTIRTNAAIFRKTTPAVSALEALYYVIGIVSIPLCWYFNHRFVVEYATGSTNPFFGPGSWSEFIELGYDNPQRVTAAALHHHRRPPPRDPATLAVLRLQSVHQLQLRLGVLPCHCRTAAPLHAGAERLRFDASSAKRGTELA